MSDVEHLISRVEIVSELSDFKDVKLLAGLFIEYLRQEQEKEKATLGFSTKKGK